MNRIVDGNRCTDARILFGEMPDPVITKIDCGGTPERGRNLEEHLMVRLPFLSRRLAVAFTRLDPRSRIRRGFLRRSVISGYAAFNRHDLDLMLVRYAPDARFEYSPGEQTLGLDGTFVGPDEIRRGIEMLFDGWDRQEEPFCVIDLGDRVLVLSFARTRGHSSGIQLEQEFSDLITIGHDGLIVHEQAWFSWEQGLVAAGLGPEAVPLPERPVDSTVVSN